MVQTTAKCDAKILVNSQMAKVERAAFLKWGRRKGAAGENGG